MSITEAFKGGVLLLAFTLSMWLVTHLLHGPQGIEAVCFTVSSALGTALVAFVIKVLTMNPTAGSLSATDIFKPGAMEQHVLNNPETSGTPKA